MSNIYMVKKDIRFYECIPTEGYTNRLIHQDSFYFPSNVISCGLMITQNTYHSTGSGNFTGPFPLSMVGTGVDNISTLGTQVYFSAWMEYLLFNGPMSTGNRIVANLDNNTSYLTVLAIANCE